MNPSRFFYDSFRRCREALLAMDVPEQPEGMFALLFPVSVGTPADTGLVALTALFFSLCRVFVQQRVKLLLQIS